jgi:hypothetical protein
LLILYKAQEDFDLLQSLVDNNLMQAQEKQHHLPNEWMWNRADQFQHSRFVAAH